MTARLLSILLKRSLKPFVFTGGTRARSFQGIRSFGLYVHMPFCATICPFCPYFKTLYDPGVVADFKTALIAEITSAARAGARGATGSSGAGEATENGACPRVTSVYYGGGTPALFHDHLAELNAEIRGRFDVRGPFAIELHPDNVQTGLLSQLREAGFDMVSIGIQSFHEECLRTLGRSPVDSAAGIAAAEREGFRVIDVDLIFGIPGQTVGSLQEDFRIAAESGATQISTYPFIDFSFTSSGDKPLGARQKKQLLAGILEVCAETGFERTSVWTFARRGTARYSSVTRDSYVGFGPSAASLLRSTFSVNVFSVPEYIRCLKNGVQPTALSVDLTERERSLFWLFWNAYNLRIDRKAFSVMFGTEVEDSFALELWLARRAKLLEAAHYGYRLTDSGAYLFHLLEQSYTNQYIEKLWRLSLQTPWPDKLVLR